MIPDGGDRRDTTTVVGGLRPAAFAPILESSTRLTNARRKFVHIPVAPVIFVRFSGVVSNAAILNCEIIVWQVCEWLYDTIQLLENHHLQKRRP